MDTKDIEKFDPTTAELQKMVAATKDLKATDLKDPAQLAVVREKRIEFKKARVNIEKIGKGMRDEANAFNKAVLAKEKELISIIEPEELRLAAIEEEAKELAIMEERKLKLPARKERLATIKHYDPVSDDELLRLDATEFEAFFNGVNARSLEKERVEADEKARFEEEKRKEEAKKEQERIDKENEATRKAQEAKDKELADREAALKAEETRIAHEKEVEAAKKETEERMKREAAAEEDRKKREAEAKAKADADAAREEEAKKEAERKALEKREAYKAFLAEHGYTKETAGDFKTFETANGYELYKRVGIFNS